MAREKKGPARLFAQVRWNDGLGAAYTETHFAFGRLRKARIHLSNCVRHTCTERAFSIPTRT